MNNSIKRRRVIIVLGALATVILVFFVFSAVLLPRLINSQLIKEKISSGLAKSFAGRLTFGKIALLWVPRPAVVIEDAEVFFNKEAGGSIRTAKIYPSIFYLLTGRLVVRRALLQQSTLRIRLPESPTKPLDLEELEKQARSALVRLTTELRVPRIDLSDGSAEIRIGDKPPVILENVAVQTIASPVELRFELNARSSLCERLRVEGKISPENLASRIDIGVQQLKIKEALAFLPLQVSEYARQGEPSLDVKITSVGLRKFKASIGAVGPIVFARHGSTAVIEAKSLKGGITYEGGAFQIDLEQLDLGAPRLTASGVLKTYPGSWSVRINVRDVDIAEMGDLAGRIVGDGEGAKRIFHYVPAGTIPEMSFASSGRSFAEMALSKNIVVSGLLRDGKIFIPGPDLELMNVTGSVRIADRILEAKDITANLGTAKGWNGKLSLGLGGKAAPFHLDVSVRAGAPELRSLLLKLVQDEAFRGELLKVQNLAGELSGRLILGERLNAISPVVAVSKTDVSATYAPIPFPIAIRSGRFYYDQKIIRLENLQGSVGRSTLAGLGVTLHHDGSRQINVDSTRVLLDLQQTDRLIRSFKEWRPHFEKLQSAQGQIELNNLTLTGVYDHPAGWSFASTGSFNQVEIQHAGFPDRIILSRGKFEANQDRITFSDTAAALSDASLIAGGAFEYQKEGAFQFDISGMGTVGVQMTEWLSRHAELPELLKLRSPLKITAGRLAGRAGGEIYFRGQVTVAGGPRISLDAAKYPERVAVHNLTVQDGTQRARMTFQLAKDNLDVSFNGELTQHTIDRVFASFPTKGSSLRGDMQVNAALTKPIRVSARGQLSGSNLIIPFGTDKALLETFSVEASGQSVQVRSANLRWGKNHLSVSGKVTGDKDILRVDMDVTGDQLDWKEFQHSFGVERKQRQQENGAVESIPAVEGMIRVKTDRFTFERFNVSPLEMTVAISPSEIRADVDHGIACGITLTGPVDVAGKEIGLDLQLTATEAPLEPATICLTDQQNDVKGIYSLKARVAGRGDREHLLRSLKGNFEFSARNGEFIRSPGIDATFDYLNATGDFKVAFPDLDRETFPYRLVGIKGRIEGTTLLGDEINVESSLLNLSGQGKVDLERKHIDGKGLIAVLKPVDEVIARIPVISSMLGGSLLGIPVRVSGSLERPDVTYLSPADVGVELLNIPLRILGMPLGAMRLFTPSGDPRAKDITE